MGAGVDAGKVGKGVGALVDAAVGVDFGRLVLGGRVGLDVCTCVGPGVPNRLNGWAVAMVAGIVVVALVGAAVVGLGVGALVGAAVVG